MIEISILFALLALKYQIQRGRGSDWFGIEAMTSPRRENPFYNNYVFNKADLERALIKWWEYPFLFFLTTYVQINDGYVWYYKTFRGKIYYMKSEKLKPQDR